MNPKETLKMLLDAGLTQAQIARALGVSRTSIHHAVNTENWNPSYLTAQKLESLRIQQAIGAK